MGFQAGSIDHIDRHRESAFDELSEGHELKKTQVRFGFDVEKDIHVARSASFTSRRRTEQGGPPDAAPDQLRSGLL
jgi:hypothetical protein